MKWTNLVGITILLFVLVFLLVMSIRVIVHQKGLLSKDGPGYYDPVKVASTCQLPLADIYTVDGIPLINGDRVLVKDQGTSSDNGIYIASDGDWKRSSDMNSDSQIVVGSTVFVQQGFTNGSTTMVLESVSSDIMGKYGISKALTFVNQLYQALGRAGEEGDILIADPASASGVRWETPEEVEGNIDIIPEKETIIIERDTNLERRIIRLDRTKSGSNVRMVLLTGDSQMHSKIVKCSTDPGRVQILESKGNDRNNLIDIEDGENLMVSINNATDRDWEFRISIT